MMDIRRSTNRSSSEHPLKTKNFRSLMASAAIYRMSVLRRAVVSDCLEIGSLAELPCGTQDVRSFID